MATRRWPIQDAKQQFSALLRAVSGEGVQVVTKHGVDVAAVVPMEEYRRLIGDRDFKAFLRAAPELPEVERDRSTMREADLQ